ncbi:MAG TPA: helix-turn-helix transcriptional regulator [Azospirillaceae bacterium]|nr:helix-turn-helix transcriptional regulator [Azospirillaceae bacterium]
MFAGLPDSAGPIPPEGLAAHARVAEALGTPGLGDVLLEALAQVVPVDEVVAFTWAAPGRPPTIVASAGIGGRAPRRAAAYGSRYFALDPVMQAFGTLGTAAPLLAARVDAAEIADLEYRQACYREPGFVEKVSVAGRTARGWTVLSAFRRAPRGPVADAEFGRLTATGPLLLPLLAKQAELAAPAVCLGDTRLARIEARLIACFPGLAARERAVCARMLVGMTAEAIALDLGISSSSVVTYRRRAYAKMGVCSGFEIVARLFD